MDSLLIEAILSLLVLLLLSLLGLLVYCPCVNFEDAILEGGVMNDKQRQRIMQMFVRVAASSRKAGHILCQKLKAVGCHEESDWYISSAETNRP